MNDTDKPTDRTPEPSPTVQALRNSVLHAIRERDEARRHAEGWRELWAAEHGSPLHKFPWEAETK